MSVQMGVRELRDNLTAAIRRVRSGETIEITHHGERVAVLAPAQLDRIDRLHQSSFTTAGTPLEQPITRYPAVGRISASQALSEDRAER